MLDIIIDLAAVSAVSFVVKAKLLNACWRGGCGSGALRPLSLWDGVLPMLGADLTSNLSGLRDLAVLTRLQKKDCVFE